MKKIAPVWSSDIKGKKRIFFQKLSPEFLRYETSKIVDGSSAWAHFGRILWILFLENLPILDLKIFKFGVFSFVFSTFFWSKCDKYNSDGHEAEVFCEVAEVAQLLRDPLTSPSLIFDSFFCMEMDPNLVTCWHFGVPQGLYN